MNLFRPLFENFRVGFYTIALGLVVATLFITRPTPDWPINTLTILLLITAWIVEGGFRSKLLVLFKPWIWPSILLFGMYVAGVAYSADTNMALSVVERKLLLFLAPVLVATAVSFRKNHLAWSLFIFVCSGIAAMVVAYVLAIATGLGQIGENEWLDALTYQELANRILFQPIYLSFYLVFIFYGLLALFADSRFEGQWFYRKKWRTYPLLVFVFVSIIMLSSRMEVMVLFATGGALILLFLPSPAKRMQYGIIFLVSVVIALGIIMSSSENRERFTEMIDVESDYTENKYGGRSIRLHKWKNALECWMQQPLFGTGTGDMQFELNKTYAKNNFEIALHSAFNPHNQYIQTLLTIGIPGFVLLIWWFWGMIWQGWKNKNWLLFAFGVIVSLSVLTESMLERQWGVVFIAFFGTVLLADNFKYFSDNSEKAS